MPGPKCVGHRGGPHGQTGMSRFFILYRVDCQKTYGVDGFLYQLRFIARHYLLPISKSLNYVRAFKRVRPNLQPFILRRLLCKDGDSINSQRLQDKIHHGKVTGNSGPDGSQFTDHRRFEVQERNIGK
jgi:hypothetical protein